ncbi:MAG: hypothetical protein ACYC0V_21370 [Armatimonadota bacterium]
MYLALPLRKQELRDAVFTLAARNAGPFILMAPTNKLLEPDCKEILSSRKSIFLTLGDILGIDDNGAPTLDERSATILEEFHNEVIPALQPDSEECDPIAFFATPANATWSHVRIRFLNGHTVSVSAGESSGVYNFVQMGMSKKNSSTPTAQWILLKAFADGYGVFDWNSEHANRTQKKQKQLLSQALRKFFRIDGDPFRYMAQYKGWETLFEIQPCI